MRMSSEETAQVTGNLQFCFAKQRAWQPQSDRDAGPGILIEMPWTPSYSKGPARKAKQTSWKWSGLSGKWFRDSASDSATQVAHICRHYLQCVCVCGGVLLVILFCGWRKASESWSGSWKATRLESCRSGLPGQCFPGLLTTGTLATIVPSGMQNLSLSRLADAESASLRQSAHDAYAHATEWHCCGCYSLLCMLSPAEAETKDCRGHPK